MERVFEINEDEIELPRFTIDGEINSTGVSMQRIYSLPCVSCRHMRGFEHYVPFLSQCDGSV